MRTSTVFVINSVVTVGYGIALLIPTDPVLAVYGISPNPEGVYMARWFGIGLLAIGLITWFARDAAETAAGRGISRALTLTYCVGVVLATLGTLLGPFNALGLIAVGFNLLLGAAFGYVAVARAR
jgi:hypothetical protein